MEKDGHKALVAIIVILIIGLCGFVGYFMLDKSGLKLSGNSTTDVLKQDSWDIKITANEESTNNGNINLMNIDKTSIKISGTFNDKSGEIKYNLKIKNEGSITASFYSVVSDNDKIDVKVFDGTNELSNNTMLVSGDAMDVVLVIKPNGEETDFDANIKFVFNQYSK